MALEEGKTATSAELAGEETRGADKDIGSEKAKKENEGEDESEYPHGLPMALISVALGLTLFIAGLDETIVATASPTITNEFNALDDAGWYGSAYLLTMASLQLPFGKLYTILPVKWLFLGVVGLLELGSLVCALAPNSPAFIIGRAIAGMGSAGIISGCLIIVSLSIPLRKRPRYGGLIASTEGIAITVAPIIGGAFTTHVSWRWCFWINLPLGAVVAVVIVLFFNPPSTKPDEDEKKLTRMEKLKKIDFLGATVLIGSIISLLLALQWGGVRYGWNNGRIIALLVVFSVCMLGFMGIQSWKKEDAILPGRVFKQRTVFFCVVYGFCIAASSGVLSYYLPLWFQAIKNASALSSGLMLLPSILATIITGISTGFMVTELGYYSPFMLLASTFMAVGGGLLSTFTTHTNTGQWIGYQILVGLGRGMGMQQPMVAVQVVLKQADIPYGTASVIFANTLGSTICISIAQNVFLNLLRNGLKSDSLDIDPKLLLNTGVTSVKAQIPANKFPAFLKIYNHAVTRTFFIPVALACVSVLGALLIEWKSVKKPKEVDQNKEETKVVTDDCHVQTAPEATQTTAAPL